MTTEISRPGDYNHSGLTSSQYQILHRRIRKRIPKPKLCPVCNQVSPYYMANLTGNYNEDLNNWQWMCGKCHSFYDIENGFRPDSSGEKNWFWNKKHSEESLQKMRQPRPSISGEKHSMWGKHHSTETKDKIRQSLPDQSGCKNSFFGQHHSPNTRLRMRLVWSNRNVTKLRFMTGRFQTKLVAMEVHR